MYSTNYKTQDKPYSGDLAIVRYYTTENQNTKLSSQGFLTTQSSLKTPDISTKETESIKVIGQKQLQEMFTIMHKKTMPQDNIEYVQTCIRHKTGIGDPIDINFKAPMLTTSKEASLNEINYNWR